MPAALGQEGEDRSRLLSFDAVYYEPGIVEYPLGEMLKGKYAGIPWIPIENHNNIQEMRDRPNGDFPKMKRCLVAGVRKTHRYTENHKVSDWLVPYTSSGCSAMCLYCYLVCHYNKCAYLRLFVNREQMLERLIRVSRKAPAPQTFEIGSNSDLVLENQITGTLEDTIPEFARKGRGFLTFPTKFHQVEPLLSLDHQGKTIFRMSVNPPDVIRRIELGTSSLDQRLEAVNAMGEAGYPVGLLIAPVILEEGWRERYTELLEILEARLSPTVRSRMFLEIILMTYSFVHREINRDAFPGRPSLYSKEQMTGRGRGKYGYRREEREAAEGFLRLQISKILGETKILYVC